MNMDRIEFDPEELSVAEQWHGGQSSMLYAIVSTGALSRGTIRPRTDCVACGGLKHECVECHGRGQPMTDAQWLAHLAERLENEATSCAVDARERAKRARHARRRDEAREMADHTIILDGIAAKCREAIGEIGGAS